MQPEHALSAFAGVWAIVILLGLLSTGFWIWMLVDCLTNKRLDSEQRLIWVLVILFGHFIGSIVYFAVARKPGPAV